MIVKFLTFEGRAHHVMRTSLAGRLTVRTYTQELRQLSCFIHFEQLGTSFQKIWDSTEANKFRQTLALAPHSVAFFLVTFVLIRGSLCKYLCH